jgi:hypothetical protein
MATGRHDPLIGTERVVVDGTNLARTLSARGGGIPGVALIARLRAAIPADIQIELVFDGPVQGALRGERIAPKLEVRHGGRRSADDVIRSIVDDTRIRYGPAAVGGTLVVSNDTALRTSASTRGARTSSLSWLLDRMDTAGASRSANRAAPSVGNPPVHGGGNRASSRRGRASGRMRP